jgi:hypothetical protein
MIHTFHTKETKFLSNFFPIPILYNGIEYASVESDVVLHGLII